MRSLKTPRIIISCGKGCGRAHSVARVRTVAHLSRKVLLYNLNIVFHRVTLGGGQFYERASMLGLHALFDKVILFGQQEQVFRKITWKSKSFH